MSEPGQETKMSELTFPNRIIHGAVIMSPKYQVKLLNVQVRHRKLAAKICLYLPVKINMGASYCICVNQIQMLTHACTSNGICVLLRIDIVSTHLLITL